ncbi:MAG: class I SAM-dependent methyltransferase [Candidatus Aminicenantes bacterium]|nr:class I SAM-dependent methyltransferase [Candidatus Aminicenantes bacterium]
MRSSDKKPAVHSDRSFILVDQCPVCSGRSIFAYQKATFDYHHLQPEQISITDKEYGKRWDLSRCRDCGYIFANPHPAPGFLRSLYFAVEDPRYEDEAEGRSQNFVPILNQLEKFHPEKGILFDVGAATGILLNIAEKRGWQTDGIESSLWAVKKAQKKYGLNIRQGDYKTISLKPNSFSAVTMVDFIEHIPSPFEAVQKAVQMLQPGGILCLVTPDVKSLAARVMGKKWWHYRPGHLGYFSQKSLSALLERSGLSLLKKRRYAWTFSLHYILSRFRVLESFLKNPRFSSLCKSIKIKLALGDSLEIYALKGRPS